MAMDFWQIEKKTKRKTLIFLSLFVLLTLIAAGCLEIGLRAFERDEYSPPVPYFGASFVLLTLGVAWFQYWMYARFGGKYVPESMDGRLVLLDTDDPKEKQLLNIVSEIAIASTLPVPPVYILHAEEINAFAAGLNPQDAVIAITEGALKKLNRDEIQGVIAHEFGHISNGDMKLGLRLAAMIMGFYFILYLALRMLQISGRSRDDKKGNPVAIIALFLILAGVFTWFFGSILKACVSRQREYLADASSVQFTRNPQGILGALRKIMNENINDMPKHGAAYSHLYFDDHASFSARLFATHPPLQKRIEQIEGHS